MIHHEVIARARAIARALHGDSPRPAAVIPIGWIPLAEAAARAGRSSSTLRDHLSDWKAARLALQAPSRVAGRLCWYVHPQVVRLVQGIPSRVTDAFIRDHCPDELPRPAAAALSPLGPPSVVARREPGSGGGPFA